MKTINVLRIYLKPFFLKNKISNTIIKADNRIDIILIILFMCYEKYSIFKFFKPSYLSDSSIFSEYIEQFFSRNFIR